jgi:hypothetical protein
MLADRLDQVAGAAVVEEKQALPEPPKRGRAELIPACQALADLVCQARAHMMEREIGVRVNGLVGERGKGTRTGLQRRRMAHAASRSKELERTLRHGAVDGTAGGRRQESHEIGEVSDVVETAASTWPPSLKMLLGAATGEQFLVSSRSVLNSRFEMPISTLYASPANNSKDLFWAFQPNRVTVPSFPFRFRRPPIPSRPPPLISRFCCRAESEIASINPNPNVGVAIRKMMFEVLEKSS